jgi:spore maturation protein CgeB
VDKRFNDSAYASPIFILGTQRSGTTLLTRILSSHSKLFIQNEVNVLKVFKNATSKTDILNALDDQIYSRHDVTIKQILAKSENSLWGVKDPQLTEYIPQLKLFLPESKFIIIVRDGRGVVNSYKNNKWGLGTNVYSGTLRWLFEVSEQKRFMRENPQQVLLLRYEDIIKDTSQEIKKICHHLQLEFEPEMLEYYLQKAQYKKNKSNINTNKEPDASFAEKWKQELSKHEIDIIEHLANEQLISNDYDLIGRSIHISFLEKYYYKFHQMIVGEYQIQFQLKNLYIKQKLKKWGLLK